MILIQVMIHQNPPHLTSLIPTVKLTLHLAAYNEDNPFFPRFRSIPATEEELTNYLRNLRIRSLHCNSNAPEVAWFQSSTTTLLGPYGGGQYAQISKTFTKLVTLDSAHFFAWYNTLRAAFNSTGFHMDLLPKVIDMVYDADLRDSPIDGELLEGMRIKFGPKLGITGLLSIFKVNIVDLATLSILLSTMATYFHFTRVVKLRTYLRNIAQLEMDLVCFKIFYSYFTLVC
jgi:hypothetical protein